MHRSLAAMELGIPVQIRYRYPDRDGDRYDTDLVTGSGADDELLDAVLSLASWRLSAGPWVDWYDASGIR